MQLRGLLDENFRFVEAYRLQMTSEALPHSVAWTELSNDEHGPAGAWPRVVVKTAYSVAELYLLAAMDHLGSLAVLIMPPTPLFGWAVAARSSIEASARAWWLLDPALSVRQRVARSITERLYSVLERDKLARSFGMTTTDIGTTVETSWPRRTA